MVEYKFIYERVKKDVTHFLLKIPLIDDLLIDQVPRTINNFRNHTSI